MTHPIGFRNLKKLITAAAITLLTAGALMVAELNTIVMPS
tara:strand:+ start:2131 stop:2250 length:120 start_codon:yes stop_codon:yes gene_type:complete